MKVQRLGDAEIEKALVSPASVFDEPSEVVETDALARLIKIEILRRWDAADGSTALDAVRAALALLDPGEEAI